MAMALLSSIWKHYVMSSYTIAYTDSSNHKILTNLTTHSTRVVRWIAALSLYNSKVRHIPGSTNTAADALLRIYPEESLYFLEIDAAPDWDDTYKADTALLELCYQPDEHLTNGWRQAWHGGCIWIGAVSLFITRIHQP